MIGGLVMGTPLRIPFWMGIGALALEGFQGHLDQIAPFLRRL